jgi:hypothetical protein
MKQISTIIILALAFGFSSCEKVIGEGPVITETRNIVNFNGVDLRVSGDVYYKQDSVYKVEIKAQQNMLNVMQTYLINNHLVISFKNDIRVRSDEPVMIIISSPSVNSLRISGSGSIYTTGPITPAVMEMDISGSGNIKLTELKTGYLDCNISGSGNIQVLSGTVTEEKLKISGSGNINLDPVVALKANTTTSGSGDTRLQATQNLNVTISGSGSVYYKGNPVINTSISGSGKIIHQ